ncbi:hypothetical protein ACOME3_004975 [Neoechinorhynchus agilis]
MNEKLHLGREDMICLAMLSGCDYTEGIHGVGVENAVSICREFRGLTAYDRLTEFKKWWTERRDKCQSKNRKRWARLHVPNSFPCWNIYEALKNPDVLPADVASKVAVFPKFNRIRSFIGNWM